MKACGVRIAPTGRGHWIGRFPRIALRSIRGYFRSLPTGECGSRPFTTREQIDSARRSYPPHGRNVGAGRLRQESKSILPGDRTLRMEGMWESTVYDKRANDSASRSYPPHGRDVAAKFVLSLREECGRRPFVRRRKKSPPKEHFASEALAVHKELRGPVVGAGGR